MLKKKFQNGFSFSKEHLHLEGGKTITFIGKNGAGKSTFFQMITGNLDPDEGKILINGERFSTESYHLKRKFGYLPQNFSLPTWVSPLEVLRYVVSLYKIPDGKTRIEESLNFWDCYSFKNKPLASCSHGMQKRVALSIASIHEPDFLILDEPFSGLDIFHLESLEKTIYNRKKNGKLTIISSHIAPYIAQTSQEIYGICEGKIEAFDVWESLSFEKKVEKIRSYFGIKSIYKT
tara:strand:- start:1269 stop:1970 length:702 start_codon:yes stop_codon:yes gene_type:complete